MKILTERVGDHSLIKIENDCGLSLVLSSLGAGIREIRVPDREGKRVLVTACPEVEEDNRFDYYGKIIGRTSGRIAGATFQIGEKRAQLEKNNLGCDNLHGGALGLHRAIFDFKTDSTDSYADIIFTYFSPDGEGGYFGNAKIEIIYRIEKDSNSFKIIFKGEVDEPTLLNLTNHVYWNVSGNLSESVRDSVLYVNAPEYGLLSKRLSTQKIVPVTKEFDFRTPRKIGEFIDAEIVKKYTGGYDHPFFLDKGKDGAACSLYSQKSGIELVVKTTYPCVVIYTDNFADPKRKVGEGVNDSKHLAICLECQYHPDGIHACPDNCGICTPQSPYLEITEYIFNIK